MSVMQSLPVPCPAGQIPDATGIAAFNAAYEAAQGAGAVFVCIARSGQRWTVKADTFTAPAHVVDEAAAAAIREAAIRLIRDRTVRPGSAVGPAYVVLYDLVGEDRARELAAALHAALYGDLEPLASAWCCPRGGVARPFPARHASGGVGDQGEKAQVARAVGLYAAAMQLTNRQLHAVVNAESHEVHEPDLGSCGDQEGKGGSRRRL